MKRGEILCEMNFFHTAGPFKHDWQIRKYEHLFHHFFCLISSGTVVSYLIRENMIQTQEFFNIFLLIVKC